MRIHALMDCSFVNGPGGRAVVWFQGCEIHCPGCWNESTHRRDLGLAIEVAEVVARIGRAAQAYGLEGVTISGGEPMHQVSEVIELVSVLKREVSLLSAGLFTGYAEHELDAGRFHTYLPATAATRQAHWRELRSLLDFVVLGRYNRNEPTTAPLLSSRNQKLRLFSGRYRLEDFHEPQLEISIDPDGLTQITGFPLLGSME